MNISRRLSSSNPEHSRKFKSTSEPSFASCANPTLEIRLLHARLNRVMEDRTVHSRVNAASVRAVLLRSTSLRWPVLWRRATSNPVTCSATSSTWRHAEEMHWLNVRLRVVRVGVRVRLGVGVTLRVRVRTLTV